MKAASIEGCLLEDLPETRPGRPGLVLSRRAGFTLLEVLLVAFIALLAAAVAVPSFMRSYKGAKLKASSRTIASVHRFTRSMAVLQQQQAVVLIDTEAGTLTVYAMIAQGGFRGRVADLPSVNASDSAGPAGEGDGPQYTQELRLKKSLEADVQFVDVDLANRDQQEGGIYWINYYVNGMCDKYEVTVEDQDGKRKVIDVDHISGMVDIND